MANPKINIRVKGFGTMSAELYPDKAPKTVENFLKLANENFFDGLIFHRVIPGFMIQGGGYDETMAGKETPSIAGEFKANGFAANDLRHTRGVLSMARTSDPNSASSQFFVMHEDAPHLDGQYAGFGQLTDGYDVLDAIASVKTGNYGWYMQDVPCTAVVIETIEVAE
ncbi:MAG: peptidylprolyl isomerase [Clostridia bacterium]|nr:peptidylprolyl isomerase [Clostridia bacterium]